MAASEDTLSRIRGFLQNDLRLGDGTAIRDDMPLIGGDHDLDSLDVLMLVTSIEKGFGIKIPNETIGREAFATVSALAEFVDRARERAARPVDEE